MDQLRRQGAPFHDQTDHDIKGELYQAFGIEGARELYDAHVIVEGIMSQGMKLSVNVSDLQKIAFLPKR
ncbi:hypothetical protein ACX801_16750 [Arthrobacter bambusae]